MNVSMAVLGNADSGNTLLPKRALISVLLPEVNVPMTTTLNNPSVTMRASSIQRLC